MAHNAYTLNTNGDDNNLTSAGLLWLNDAAYTKNYATRDGSKYIIFIVVVVLPYA